MRIVNELAALRLLEAVSRRARQDLQGRSISANVSESARDFVDYFLEDNRIMRSIQQDFDDKFLGRAKAIDGRITAVKDQVRNDMTLSDLGRHQAIATAVKEREPAIAALQAEARKWLQAEHLQAAAAVAYKRAAKVEERRKALGTELLATIYQREIGMMTPDEILQEYRDSAPGWERAVIAEYGRLALLQTQAGADTQGAMRAQMALTEMEGPADPELETAKETMRLLGRNLDNLVSRLDLYAYRQETADKLGVNPELFDVADIA